MILEDLQGKVAIVTGATGGLGAAIVKAFLEQGAVVVAGYHSEPLKDDFREYGERLIGVRGDLADPKIADALVATGSERGGPHIVVNAGGNFLPGQLLEIGDHEFEAVVRVHLFGTWYLCTRAIREMIDRGIRGAVVNMTSRTGLRGFTGEANYAAAKAGVAGLTLAMAEEVKEVGVRVNAIAPVSWSVRAESLPNSAREREWAARSKNVLGRPGLPEDVAPMVLFLCSDAAMYVTGQIIQVTGHAMHLQ